MTLREAARRWAEKFTEYTDEDLREIAIGWLSDDMLEPIDAELVLAVREGMK